MIKWLLRWICYINFQLISGTSNQTFLTRGFHNIQTDIKTKLCHKYCRSRNCINFLLDHLLEAYMDTKITRITCIFEQNSLQISKLTISKLQNHFANFILPIPIPFQMIFKLQFANFSNFSNIIFEICFSKCPFSK